MQQLLESLKLFISIIVNSSSYERYRIFTMFEANARELAIVVTDVDNVEISVVFIGETTRTKSLGHLNTLQLDLLYFSRFTKVHVERRKGRCSNRGRGEGTGVLTRATLHQQRHSGDF